MYFTPKGFDEFCRWAKSDHGDEGLEGDKIQNREYLIFCKLYEER